MTTRTKSSTVPRNAASGTDQSAPNLLADWGRHHLAIVAQGTSALCRSREALRKIQQEAAHDASVFHAEAGRKLLAPCAPADLMAIQSELVRFALQNAGKYWQRVAANAVNTQVEMMASLGQVLQSETDNGMRTPLESVIAPLASSFHLADTDEGNDEKQKLHS